MHLSVCILYCVYAVQCLAVLFASTVQLVQHLAKFIHSSIANSQLTMHRKLSYYHISKLKTFILFCFIFGQNYNFDTALFVKHHAFVKMPCHCKLHAIQLWSAMHQGQEALHPTVDKYHAPWLRSKMPHNWEAPCPVVQKHHALWLRSTVPHGWSTMLHLAPLHHCTTLTYNQQTICLYIPRL